MYVNVAECQNKHLFLDLDWIDASGSTGQVMKSILKELNYQASFELDPELYDAIAHIPTAKKIRVQHRQVGQDKRQESAPF